MLDGEDLTQKTRAVLEADLRKVNTKLAELKAAGVL
jgi:hypothetical protein